MEKECSKMEQKNGSNSVETDEERRLREEQEIAERNELSMIRMLVRHNQQIGIVGNMNIFKPSAEDERKKQVPDISSGSISDGLGSISVAGSIASSDEAFFHQYQREDLRRTVSMVSWGSGPAQTQVMTKRYKLITSAVLWFCYYSLALNDYIFGPTFNDLSLILGVSFDRIAYFVVYRQLAYTFGSLGGIAFDYVNRQLFLIALLLLSGASLMVTPYVPDVGWLFLIAVVNGFAAGACDVGFHVWILEMFQNGGGPLLQALHFSFGLGIASAPLISAQFLDESEGCSASVNDEIILSDYEIQHRRQTLFIPYLITGLIVSAGGIILLGLYLYKSYIPPQERKLPASFDQQMPKQLTRSEKIELWKRSLPSFYIISIIILGSVMLWSYYGLEVTFFQFLAQFSNAVPLPIHGSMSANLEAATGSAYAIGGLLAIWASFQIHPENMIYLNFILMNIGNYILLKCSETSLPWFWVGNIVIGFGFSSCYATAYTFLEHQINVTNVIGSIFLFAGGAGTAIFPILLAEICSKPLYLIYLSIFCSNLALLLFVVMHFITKIRQRQVKLIQDRLMKNPAMLVKIKQRTLSQLSYAPQ
ncbi:hypothetical protein DERF_001948 [Dermatophagoides farinae]|uniref:Sodium-dependent glucose transporter 1 n=1 Tax=Dermatophagoides farinae TaxID=6954 RepID=A0A922L958_DERFA|nr:hypothetical protein DERF_001948 [Dermatophagoides farinae]